MIAKSETESQSASLFDKSTDLFDITWCHFGRMQGAILRTL
jgi:hypothetical protein